MNICMISDFYYPNVGGVENHIHFLSEELIKRGHRVVIVTHAYAAHRGVVYPMAGLKVYYLNLLVMANQCTLPTTGANLLIYRSIFTRERIDLVHGHQAFSSMAHEGLLHARLLDLPTVFTDHSLFGFADVSSILTNKILKFSLGNVNAVICVSHTSRENTVLRAALDPSLVYVIPNAIHGDLFKPPLSMGKVSDTTSMDKINDTTPMPKVDDTTTTVIVLSRLVYRKGIDLLIQVIPLICAKYGRRVKFVIGGDGPKKVDLEQMREQHNLHDQVDLIGPVSTKGVPAVLQRGDIFLNCSLTEAFCMAIVEAACCGLRVVSTNVGGIPEVLPQKYLCLSPPISADLTKALMDAIEEVQLNPPDKQAMHEAVRRMYSWEDVAVRTELVYHAVVCAPKLPLVETLKGYYGCGPLAGKLACAMLLLLRMYLYFINIPIEHTITECSYKSIKLY